MNIHQQNNWQISKQQLTTTEYYMNYNIQSNDSIVTIMIDIQHFSRIEHREIIVANAIRTAIALYPKHIGILKIYLINASSILGSHIKNFHDIHILDSYNLGESNFTQVELHINEELNNAIERNYILADIHKLEEIRMQNYYRKKILTDLDSN